jgi:hypothetical protein
MEVAAYSIQKLGNIYKYCTQQLKSTFATWKKQLHMYNAPSNPTLREREHRQFHIFYQLWRLAKSWPCQRCLGRENINLTFMQSASLYWFELARACMPCEVCCTTLRTACQYLGAVVARCKCQHISFKVARKHLGEVIPNI